MFTNSERSRKHRSGLDYTKIVIVKDLQYLDAIDSVIDQDEYIETRKNIKRIKKEAQEFVDAYISHVTGKTVLHSREFDRRYHFSPLKYFHHELGILE